MFWMTFLNEDVISNIGLRETPFLDNRPLKLALMWCQVFEGCGGPRDVTVGPI